MKEKVIYVVDRSEIAVNFEEYMKNIEKQSKVEIKKLHRLSKRMWTRSKLTPIDVHNRCLEAWDAMKHDLGTDIIPIIPVKETQTVLNEL